MSKFRRWRTSDRLAAIALEQYEAMLCSGCGHPLHESMDIESDGEWVAEEMRCHACTKAIEHGKKFSAASAPQALKISTRRKTRDRSHDQ